MDRYQFLQPKSKSQFFIRIFCIGITLNRVLSPLVKMILVLKPTKYRHPEVQCWWSIAPCKHIWWSPMHRRHTRHGCLLLYFITSHSIADSNIGCRTPQLHNCYVNCCNEDWLCNIITQTPRCLPKFDELSFITVSSLDSLEIAMLENIYWSWLAFDAQSFLSIPNNHAFFKVCKEQVLYLIISCGYNKRICPKEPKPYKSTYCIQHWVIHLKHFNKPYYS